MDFLFMEFFVLKKHGEKLEDYFKTTRQSVSLWKKTGIPEKRLLQFQVKEGSLDPKELILKIY
jgi:hypothetical protein